MTPTVAAHGYTILRNLISDESVHALAGALPSPESTGQRGMLAQPLVWELANSPALLNAVSPWLSGKPAVVRAIYFDKTPGVNWLVPWHQDPTIAVLTRADCPGFGPWSSKEGLVHVQPPAEYLEDMITLRLHVDATDHTNGALRLLPGTHCHGKLSSAQIQHFRDRVPEHLCDAAAGDALLMRPLLLHASSRSSSLRSRRILHLEYSGRSLPGGLQWNHEA